MANFGSVLIFILTISLFYIIFLNNLFFLTLMLNVASLTMANLYLIKSAPDIAITEIIVNFGVNAVFTILSLIYINRQKEIKPKEDRLDIFFINNRAILLILIFVISFFVSEFINSMNINSYFEEIKKIGNFYIQNTTKDFGIPSIVTSVIAGYRAIDTFFECIVIFSGAFVVKNIIKD